MSFDYRSDGILDRPLIVGVTGIVGQALAERVVPQAQRVIGLAHRNVSPVMGVETRRVDVTDAEAVRDALADIRPSSVFLTAWSRRASAEEAVEVNGAFVRHVLEAVCGPGEVRHVGLVTGAGHYLGPAPDRPGAAPDQTPFPEDTPRRAVAKFYYAQEDELHAAAARHGFTWSVHRPHSVIGYAVGNAMNMASTLAVYAELCRETGRPFAFPGTAAMWDGLTQSTDAGLLAEHVLWAARDEAVRGEPLNVTNGDLLRWSWLWPRLAALLDVEAELHDGRHRPLPEDDPELARAWTRIAHRHDLREADLDRVASFWHTNADLGLEAECLIDVSRSRELGFTGHTRTLGSFARAVGRLRAEHVLPPARPSSHPRGR